MGDQPDQPKWEDFEPPPEAIEEAEGILPEMPEAAAAQAAAAEATSEVAALSEAPSPVREAKEAVEELLATRVGAAPSALAIDSHAGEGNIQGVAIGVGDEISSLAAGASPGDSTLTVYVAEPVSTDEVRSVLVDSLGVKAAGDKVPIEVVVTGLITAYPHTFRERPSPCGVSIAHQNVTAGTQGCLCFGRQAPRNGRVMVLSNNHVLAAENAGSAGDCVCQPGPADGGSCPNDQVAVLERFVPLDFSGGPNVVDCATAWAWPDRVRIEQVYLSSGTPTYFRTGNTPVAAAIGMEVGKSGRTTQLKKGRIDAVGGSVSVGYGAGTALFQDILSIRGVAGGGNFSQPGDSGSLIWQWAAGVAPVGLLFAGGGDLTFANRIESVMAALDIWLYT
jgi:hypothetical protein